MRETYKNILLIVSILMLLSALAIPVYYNPHPPVFLLHYYSEAAQYNLINPTFSISIIIVLLSLISYLIVYRSVKKNWLLLCLLFFTVVLAFPVLNDLDGYSFLVSNINNNNPNNNIIVALSFAVISITVFLLVYKRLKNTWLLISILLAGTALLVPTLNNLAGSYYLINNIGNNSINNNITVGISFAIVSITIFLLVYKQLKNTWLLICFLLFLGILVIPVLQNTDPFFIIENYIKNNRVNNDTLVFTICLAFIGISSFLIAYKLSTRTWIPIFILLLLALLIVPAMNEKDQFFCIYNYYSISKSEKELSPKQIQYASNEKGIVVSNLPVTDTSNSINLNETKLPVNLKKDTTNNHLIKADNNIARKKDTTNNITDTKTDNLITDNNASASSIPVNEDAPPAEKFADIKSISPDDKLISKMVTIRGRNALMVFPSSDQWKEMFVIFPIHHSQQKSLRNQVLREFEGVTYPSYQGGTLNTNGKLTDITLVKFKGPQPKDIKPYYLFLNSNFSFLIFGDYTNTNLWYIFQNGKVSSFRQMSDLKFDK